MQIEDLRNDENLKFTNDKTGIEVVERDLIIAWDGANVGTIGFGKKGYIGSTLARLRIKDPQKFHPAFLGKFLQSQFKYLRQTATGATIPHINKAALEGIKIPILPLSDQIRIATLLSRAEALIEKRRESLRLLDALVKGVFLEMFGDPVRNEKGWEKVKLQNVTTKIGSGATPRGGKESYISDGIALVRSMNVHNNKFVYKDLAYIDETQAYDLRNVTLSENDVLLNITGASVARCCILPDSILPARVNQHVSIIRTKSSKLEPVFLNRVLTSDNFQKLLIKQARSKGATREALTKEEIEEIMIPLPPLPLQTQFAGIVRQVETLKAKYAASLAELENLYGSLSQRAFRGELG